MTLVDYVKFSVTSLDNAGTSKPIFAIIAPGLCLPSILSLPFLVQNNIVIDHADRTAVDKVSSYDLLNPPMIKPSCPPPPKLREHIKQTKKIKKKVLSELLALCNDRIKNGTLLFDNIKEVDCIGAVRDAIEKLSAEEHLIKLGIKVKLDFPDIFEPIPHADLLPSNYLTHIKLKDMEKQITNHTYSCPRKFKEDFQTLIQQHMDAGRIRHSSSPHASPCFIVPKSDPTVLSQWVNDYR